MSKIRSENTSIEKLVFKELRRRKIYFQQHYKGVMGNPDLALPRKKKAVFIDGDFWHGYKPFRLIWRLPKVYWRDKIKRNILRDKKNNKELRKAGWKILRVWEHELINDFTITIEKIVSFLIS